MPADTQPALKNATGWIFSNGYQKCLVLHLETAELLVEKKHRLNNYADRIRCNTGIERIRVYTPPIYCGELTYNPAGGRWHLDTTPIHA